MPGIACKVDQWNDYIACSKHKAIANKGCCSSGGSPAAAAVQTEECLMPAEFSSGPVRYVSGELRYVESDLAAQGFGRRFGHTRSFMTTTSQSVDKGFGHGWRNEDVPFLVQTPGSHGAIHPVIFVKGGNHLVYFHWNTTTSLWEVELEQPYTLTVDSGNSQLVVQEADGTIWRFHDFTQTSNPKGLLVSMTDPAGHDLTVTSYSSSKIGEIQRSVTIGGTTTIESFLYTYFTTGDQAGRLESVLLRRKVGAGSWTDLRRCVYDYYGSSEDYGSLGDLKTATRQQWSGSAWQDLGTSYYRYYKLGDSNGFEHALQYALTPEAFDRLSDATNPFTASNSTVSAYADFYFEYDSDRRVTKERVQGASCGNAAHGETTFAYTESFNSDSLTNWKNKTVETRPDGSTFTVYCNYAGRVLLTDLVSGSDRWTNVYEYSKINRLSKHALPSAVASYSDSSANLSISLRSSAGLIREYAYFTTSGSGAAVDKLDTVGVRQGTSGSLVVIEEYEYSIRTVSGKDVAFPSKVTKYRNDNGTGGVDTLTSYSFFSGTFQPEQITTTYPAVPTAQNGENATHDFVQRFDAYGYPTWRKDTRGVITRQQVDIVTGGLVEQIDDVDTSQTSDEPSGWSTVSGFGLHAVNSVEVDAYGQPIQRLGPEHQIDIAGTATTVRSALWIVNDDVGHELRMARGYASGSGFTTMTLVNPVEITKFDFAGRTIEEIHATRSSTSGKLLSTDTFARSSYVRWSTRHYTDTCQQDWQRVYHTIPSSGDGSSGTNYDATEFGYDTMGRRNKVKSPGGTITRTVFEVRGMPTAVFVGTNDASATNADPTGGGASGNDMVQTDGYQYDGGADEGDGLLTQHVAKVDSSSGNDRTTAFGYDFRGRRTSVDGEIDLYQETVYDNLDRAVEQRSRNTSSGGNMVAKSEALYDDRGRVYRTKRYAVDPATGTAGNALQDDSWFDAAGNLVKSKPSGGSAFTKTKLDGLGRATKSWLAFGSDSSYADAISISGNTVVEQTETAFDLAGNAVLTTHRRRFHNATGTGELTTPSGSQPKARVMCSASYPDALGREQARVDVGTNGNSAYTRPTTIPAAADDTLVSLTAYNGDGEAWKTTDPAGKEDRESFDDAGRRTQRIENWKSSPSTADENVTTEWTYTSGGHVKTFTAVNSATGNQVTKYVYGTTLSDSSVARSDLLRAEIYPDSDDVDSPLGNGTDGIYDRVEFKYNRQVERIEKKDQNETVHAYDYDKLGRLIHDRATSLGSGVDNAVRRISTTYEVRGVPAKTTSYDNAAVGSGSVVNEVERVYNTFGQLITEYQEHGGAVNTSTSPKTQYAYADGSANHVRQTSLTYPNGTAVDKQYGSSASIDDVLSRVAKLRYNSSDLALMTYLGAGTVVEMDYVPGEVKYRLNLGAGSDPYEGLDRFDRVVDLVWRSHASTDLERMKYGYDRASNRLWMERLADSNRIHDELYTYDGTHRLKTFKRGTVNTGHTAMTTLKFAQEWGLDATGNWASFKEDSNGDSTWDLVQARTSNKVNEISAITETSGPSWVDPAYGKAGVMTTVPKPADPTTSFAATYDAWERLVKLMNGSDVVVTNAYDGVNRLVVKGSYTSGSLTETRHSYYNADWQCLEERVGSSSTPDRHFLWGVRYIDDLVCDVNDFTSGPVLDRFALNDVQFSVYALVGPNDAVHERVRYAAYGTPTFLDAGFAVLGVHTLVYQVRLWCGYTWDRSCKLFEIRRRIFHSQAGQWISRDPLGYSGGRASLLEIVGGQPTFHADSSGLRWTVVGTKKARCRIIRRRMVGGRELCDFQCTCPPGSYPGWEIMRHHNLPCDTKLGTRCIVWGWEPDPVPVYVPFIALAGAIIYQIGRAGRCSTPIGAGSVAIGAAVSPPPEVPKPRPIPPVPLGRPEDPEPVQSPGDDCRQIGKFILEAARKQCMSMPRLTLQQLLSCIRRLVNSAPQPAACRGMIEEMTEEMIDAILNGR
jgi:hypothetical protein